MTEMIKRLHPLVIIRLGLAFVFLFFGVHKFLDPLVWIGFIPPIVLKMVPFSANVFIHLQGTLELLLGVALFFGILVRYVSLIAALLLAGIIISVGIDPIAARDVGLLSMALALAVAKEHPLSLHFMQKK